MKKYVCDPCGWIYDPEVGDPDGGIEREPHLRIFRMIGYVLSAESEKICSLLLKNKMCAGAYSRIKPGNRRLFI